eukprot:jgi/Chrzof1/8549/Cz03g15090.t1
MQGLLFEVRLRTTWSPDMHKAFPARFKVAARQVLMGSVATRRLSPSSLSLNDIKAMVMDVAQHPMSYLKKIPTSVASAAAYTCRFWEPAHTGRNSKEHGLGGNPSMDACVQAARESATAGTAAPSPRLHQPAELKGADMPSALSSVTSSSSSSSRRQAVASGCGLARLPKEVLVDIIRRAALPLSCWVQPRPDPNTVDDYGWQCASYLDGKVY